MQPAGNKARSWPQPIAAQNIRFVKTTSIK